MAAPNVGGSSNNASGNTPLRMSLVRKIDKCSDRLVDLEMLAEKKQSKQLLEVIERQKAEIAELERQLALLR